MRHNHQIVCHQLLYVFAIFISDCKYVGKFFIAQIFFISLTPGGNIRSCHNATLAWIFQSIGQSIFLKLFLIIFLAVLSNTVTAQKVDSIYVHLYTDSLKKGVYNYINIDGKLPNGRFVPLDTADVTFTSSGGTFYGNSLWVEPGFNKTNITIKAVLKSNPAVFKEFTLYIKKKRDDSKLKTVDEIMNESNMTSKRTRRK